MQYSVVRNRGQHSMNARKIDCFACPLRIIERGIRSLFYQDIHARLSRQSINNKQEPIMGKLFEELKRRKVVRKWHRGAFAGAGIPGYRI